MQSITPIRLIGVELASTCQCTNSHTLGGHSGQPELDNEKVGRALNCGGYWCYCCLPVTDGSLKVFFSGLILSYFIMVVHSTQHRHLYLKKNKKQKLVQNHVTRRGEVVCTFSPLESAAAAMHFGYLTWSVNGTYFQKEPTAGYHTASAAWLMPSVYASARLICSKPECKSKTWIRTSSHCEELLKKKTTKK